VFTNNFISFSIQLADGCLEDANGSKDETYDETTNTSLPPVVSLVGSTKIYIEVGDTFTDPGARTTDDVDGDLNDEGDILIVAAPPDYVYLNPNIAGTYITLFQVFDAASNTATRTRTIIVSAAADTKAPVITLTGSSIINLTVGDTFT
tara:strand:+ start:202 stop:648 length:447 start_codon:yes stop_codon:yes gene_type:complete